MEKELINKNWPEIKNATEILDDIKEMGVLIYNRGWCIDHDVWVVGPKFFEMYIKNDENFVSVKKDK